MFDTQTEVQSEAVAEAAQTAPRVQVEDVALRHTAEIVSAFLSRNPLEAEQIPGLIQSVYSTLTTAGAPPPPAELVPAVPVKKSITADHLVCLEDGKKLTMLRRHLKTSYNLTPEQYREKWSLPRDYPMVAPNYAARRSYLAKQIGLGRKRAA